MNSNLVKFYKNNVFDNTKIKDFVSKNTYNALQDWILCDKKITEGQANEIAIAMKNWAINNGAKHFTHWFQPLNGKTAEKHNTFLSLDKKGEPIENFSGNALVSAEADASSFPSGGLRVTFEARGYVAWDASGPVFIYDDNGIKTLCIPSTFITYNGESVDLKLPLLKAKNALNEKAKELLSFFGKNPQKVFLTAGLEQEYFLIDETAYNKRDDLRMLGKTLFGLRAPKTQQMQDQYFGNINSKILKYMDEVGNECIKYGIPITTRHNEVAPNQYEFAPYFEEDNLANDHNQLLMIVMSNIARKNGLVALFDEKPFLDVNGSGKHLNWSISDNEGNNFLQCSADPKENLQFLTFIVVAIQAVYDYSDLLISSIANSGNERRLGGHEAPPSILSIFLGHFLNQTLNTIEKGDKIDNIKAKIYSNFKKMPNFERENTDRNRTSPFAFTGNKFEFRGVGSSQNAAIPMTILNTILADSIDKIINLIKKEQKATETFEETLLHTLQKIIMRTKNIRFEKDGYSKEWQKEAIKRGLYVNQKLLTSLKEYIAPKNLKLFKNFDVLTEIELKSRCSAWSDLYKTNKLIEINTLLEILENIIIPDVLSYRTFLINGIKEAENILPISVFKSEKKMLEEYAKLINELFKEKNELINTKKVFRDKIEIDAINYTYESVNPILENIKNILDKLEKKTGNEYWSLLKYKDMLYY
ncbi:MAG: glutamine synthetase III [Rickettsiales bacterium]|jgi:glutamine synthetase|nr:glutamine synthetase III [Rickettsiales bacterium]